MSQPNIVIDTNVLIAALRSAEGSANRLVMLIGQGQFDISLSVPLLLEYEEVCKRQRSQLSWSVEDVDDLLTFLCGVARPTAIHYKWPLLPDPDDDMVLELAIAAQCDCIVTFNNTDFLGADQFGIQILTPFEFLQAIQFRP
jgi:putative PIN family toxin of toxin-antitoxin system